MCWSLCLCSLEIIERLAVKLLQCLVCLAFKAGSQRHCLGGFGGLELLVSHNVLVLLPARDRKCLFNHYSKRHKAQRSKLSFPYLGDRKVVATEYWPVSFPQFKMPSGHLQCRLQSLQHILVYYNQTQQLQATPPFASSLALQDFVGLELWPQCGSDLNKVGD